MSDELDLQNESLAPKVEKVSLDEIRKEVKSQEDRETDELVDRIMQQILKIK